MGNCLQDTFLRDRTGKLVPGPEPEHWLQVTSIRTELENWLQLLGTELEKWLQDISLRDRTGKLVRMFSQ
jgi:hypothetical protein